MFIIKEYKYLFTTNWLFGVFVNCSWILLNLKQMDGTLGSSSWVDNIGRLSLNGWTNHNFTLTAPAWKLTQITPYFNMLGIKDVFLLWKTTFLVVCGGNFHIFLNISPTLGGVGCVFLQVYPNTIKLWPHRNYPSSFWKFNVHPPIHPTREVDTKLWMSKINAKIQQSMAK